MSKREINKQRVEERERVGEGETERVRERDREREICFLLAIVSSQAIRHIFFRIQNIYLLGRNLPWLYIFSKAKQNVYNVLFLKWLLGAFWSISTY